MVRHPCPQQRKRNNNLAWQLIIYIQVTRANDELLGMIPFTIFVRGQLDPKLAVIRLDSRDEQKQLIRATQCSTAPVYDDDVDCGLCIE